MSFFRDYELRANNPPYETAAGTSRNRGRALSFDGKLWIMGGDGSGPDPTRRDVWSSSDGGATWTQTTSTAWSGVKRDFAVCVHNGKMVVSGGNAGADGLNDVHSSTDGITWTVVRADGAASGFAARQLHAMLSFNSKLWIVGGQFSSTDKNDVWYSEDDGATWTQATAAAAWSARRYPVLASHDSKLWLIAGSASSALQSDVWHTTDGITWTQATAAIGFAARHNAIAFSRDGFLYAGFGGTGGGSQQDLWRSAAGASWAEVHAEATIFSGVSGGPSGIWHTTDGSIYVLMATAASGEVDNSNRSVWRSILAGELVETNANDTLAASGEAINPAGTLAKTNANDTLTASGQTSTSGTLAETNADDTLHGVLYGTLNPPDPPPGDTIVAVGVADFRINTGSKVPYFYLGEDELLDVKYYRPIYYWESMDPDKFDNLGEDDLDQLDDEVFQVKYENMTKSEFVAWKKRTRGF